MAHETFDVVKTGTDTSLPTMYIVSDSLGATAMAVARASAGQFGVTDPRVETLSKARDVQLIKRYLMRRKEEHIQAGLDPHLVVYYTLVDERSREELAVFCAEQGLYAVDIMDGPLTALQRATQKSPSTFPGMLRATDQNYFRRIAAMEFTVEHDDGRNTQDLPKADIVLMGVSRSSKTPISIYMGIQGYKVANVPLALGTEPPSELFECDPSRVFGLMTTPEVLQGIRKRRLDTSGKMASSVASSYADAESIYRDLEEARALMKKIGCYVIRTDNKAVEETAQEILRYYELSHPLHQAVLGG